MCRHYYYRYCCYLLLLRERVCSLLVRVSTRSVWKVTGLGVLCEISGRKRDKRMVISSNMISWEYITVILAFCNHWIWFHMLLFTPPLMRKVCAKMVPKLLNVDEERRMQVCQDIIERLQTEPDLFRRVMDFWVWPGNQAPEMSVEVDVDGDGGRTNQLLRRQSKSKVKVMPSWSRSSKLINCLWHQSRYFSDRPCRPRIKLKWVGEGGGDSVIACSQELCAESRLAVWAVPRPNVSRMVSVDVKTDLLNHAHSALVSRLVPNNYVNPDIRGH